MVYHYPELARAHFGTAVTKVDEVRRALMDGASPGGTRDPA